MIAVNVIQGKEVEVACYLDVEFNLSSRWLERLRKRTNFHSFIHLFVHHTSFKKLHLCGCGYHHNNVKNTMQQCNCQQTRK
jgi:hypothetical protein